MKKSYKFIIINSTILFVIASIIEMTFHEMGHFVAAVIVQAKDVVLYHNSVFDSAEGLSINKIILIKAAGPIVSLLIGLIFQYICSKQQSRGLIFLFNLYMSIFGYIGVFGYLIIAPFFSNGDTGYICQALNFPIWLTIIIAVLGLVALYMTMLILVKHFVELGTLEIANNKELRFPFIQSLILYPLFIGIVITTLLNLPVPIFLSLITPICSPFTIMWVYGNALMQKYPTAKMSIDIRPINTIHYKSFIFLAVIIIVNRLLVNGFTIN